MRTDLPKEEGREMTGAQAIVECMKLEGVEKVFCVPGESYLPLLDVLYDETSIPVISARHESGAAFMADGYGKSSLKPGIVLATRGVGAANLSIGVHTAYQDSTPMVVMLGQVHRKFRGREGFQEVELDQWFRHIAKWTVEVTDSERLPEFVQRAFRVAQSGRPGPVIISLPEDVLPATAKMTFGPRFMKPTPSPSKQEIARVERLLEQAEPPLIIAGGGVKGSTAETELRKFAESYHLPVVAAFRRQDAFPNDHPLYAGHLGLGTNPQILKTVHQADVILALGTRLSEVTTQDYSIIDRTKKLIHIDIDPETIGKVYAPDVGIVADIREALKLTWKKWADERHNKFVAVSRLKVSSDDHLNKHVIHLLAEKLPRNALLANDAGNFAGWLHTFYPFTETHTYVGPTSGAMGYGMPAALGAKLALPEKTVVSLSGDGGFMMTVQELETAVRCQIPVISLVFNNKMYGTIRMHQETHYPEKVMATDLGQVSFADLAKSVGANGFCVKTADAFERVFERVMQTKQTKPVVIEILTDKEQISVSSTIQELRER